VRGCRLRLAQKLSSDSSGSIATSSAASRHRSAGLRRRPSSSKMRTSVRLRPSSAKTRSRAALALAGRSITSVTPAPEVTVNFMARSPNCIMDVVGGHRMLQRKPRVEGSFDAGRSSMRLRKDNRPELNLSLLHGHRQSTQRLSRETAAVTSNFVYASLSLRSDTRAVSSRRRGLAHLARTGFFKPVHVKSLRAHALRSLISARKKLVGQRVTLENQIRGLAVVFGVRLPRALTCIHRPGSQSQRRVAGLSALCGV
jgi:hypothetical protein